MLLFRWFYTLLLYCLLPFALIKLLWRGRANSAYLQHWSQRFGYVKNTSQQPIIWVHAVSVGETIAIRPLIEALLTQYPHYKIWLTNGTVGGYQRTQAMFGDRVLHSYAPYDSPLMVRRFLKRVQPKLVLIMETEVWPNWMHALKQKNIPVVLVNARLSQRSYLRYRRFRCLFQKIWQNFTLILAQGEPDARRYELLGVAKNQVQTVGNLKYNLLLPENLSEQVASWRQHLQGSPIWISASTHPGEEAQLLTCFAQLKKHYPKLLWILVPRHIERSDAIQKMCQAENWSVLRRSSLAKAPTDAVYTDILLVDTIGELLLFYSLAQVAFVGGSLIEHGGHNILEPAAVGTAITCGPWMFNFATILEQFKAAHAVVQCSDVENLALETLALFENPNSRQDYIDAAKKCFDAQQHVLPTYVNLIGKFL